MEREVTEENISYWKGYLRGALRGINQHIASDYEFDPEKWRDLYGSRLVHNSVPHYPPDAETMEDGGPLLTTWDDDEEEHYLKEGVQPLRDRGGMMLFEDGTVVEMHRDSNPEMYSIFDRDVELIEQLSEKHLEVIRDCYLGSS